MRMKLELVKHVLENGFNVLYVDCDVTIFKNPFPFFKKYPDYSVVAQQDETICAGFMYLRPYRNTLDFLNLVSQRLLTTNAHDQDIIVSLLPVFPLKYALLPQDRFPSGGVFFNQYQYYWDRHEDELYIFHNNYVIGKRNKELRMREMHLYVVDIDGEYSDPTRKYLTFEVADSNDLANTLMRMVEMANDLNRTLVLPPTRCKDFTTRWVWCNMCAMEPFHCHRSVLEQANNGYRESVFFTNPKVPATLKYQDAHNPIHRFDSQCNSAYAYHSTFPAHRRHRNPTICHTCKRSMAYCETQFGRRQKKRVLKFYSILLSCSTNRRGEVFLQTTLHVLLHRDVQQNRLLGDVDGARDLLQLILRPLEECLELLVLLLRVQHRAARLHEVAQHVEGLLQRLAQVAQVLAQVRPAHLAVLRSTTPAASTFRLRHTHANAWYVSCLRIVPSSEKFSTVFSTDGYWLWPSALRMRRFSTPVVSWYCAISCAMSCLASASLHARSPCSRHSTRISGWQAFSIDHSPTRGAPS